MSQNLVVVGERIDIRQSGPLSEQIADRDPARAIDGRRQIAYPVIQPDGARIGEPQDGGSRKLHRH